MLLHKPYMTPRGILTGVTGRMAVESGAALPLGRDLAYTAATFTDGAQWTRGTGALDDTATAWVVAFKESPSAFAGIALTTPLIMGVVNVTPDSFSDGGRYATPDDAIARGRALRDAGAAIIDVGGESTRPGAAPVGAQDEIARVVPVVRALAGDGLCVSIDTRHADVMAAAVAAGARIVNDVTALTGDARALDVVAQSQASVMLMHMQGEPRTMQTNPTYAWAPGDVFDYLQSRIEVCRAAGIPLSRIGVDPGIGFGKNDIHNAQIFDHLAMFRALGVALIAGASRKSFIGRMSANEPPDARLPGSLAAALAAVASGAQIVRVHDVPETRQALAIAGRIAQGA